MLAPGPRRRLRDEFLGESRSEGRRCKVPPLSTVGVLLCGDPVDGITEQGLRYRAEVRSCISGPK